MNQPEAKKTPEEIEGGLCIDLTVPEVFLNLCIGAVIRDEKDGRAKETHALPFRSYQSGVPIGYRSGSRGSGSAPPRRADRLVAQSARPPLSERLL